MFPCIKAGSEGDCNTNNTVNRIFFFLRPHAWLFTFSNMNSLSFLRVVTGNFFRDNAAHNMDELKPPVKILYWQETSQQSWIGLTRPENPANTRAWHTETLDSCFDLVRFHQQRTPLEIKPATTEYRTETLTLRHKFTLHTSNAKFTSHGNCAAN